MTTLSDDSMDILLSPEALRPFHGAPFATEPDFPDLWKPKEVADRLKVKSRTIYAWILSGKLDAIRTPGGQLRIPASEVKRLLSNGAVDAEETQGNTP